jgi:hypothetical protein
VSHHEFRIDFGWSILQVPCIGLKMFGASISLVGTRVPTCTDIYMHEGTRANHERTE